MTSDQLKERDYIIALDRSPSMSRPAKQGEARTRWEAAREFTEHIARGCEKYDSNGISVFLFAGDHQGYENVTSGSKIIENIFVENGPGGSGTNTAGVLKHIFDTYFAAKKSGAAKADYDLDLFAMCLKEGGKAFGWNEGRVAYFGNKKITGIQCGPDNVTGAGAGDDESCNIDFSAIPADVHEIIVGINIYRAASKNQNFGQVNNAFVRYAPQDDTQATVKKFDLTEDYSGKTCLLAFRFYRHETGWKYQALGEATTGEIDEVYAKYQ